MADTLSTARIADVLQTELIRDLVERYPSVMPVLSSYGMDLCCGGGHTVPDAARLHGLDVDAVIAEVARAIAEARG